MKNKRILQQNCSILAHVGDRPVTLASDVIIEGVNRIHGIKSLMISMRGGEYNVPAILHVMSLSDACEMAIITHPGRYPPDRVALGNVLFNSYINDTNGEEPIRMVFEEFREKSQ